MKKALCFIAIGSLTSIIYAADSSILDNFVGSYRGNVRGTFLGVGNIAKTGHLDITQDGDTIKISCKSAFKEELVQTFSKKEIRQYFFEKATDAKLENGITETRVAFMFGKEDSYGIFDTWLGGLSQTVWAYQFKFQKGILKSCRIQQYNTEHKEKLLYLLELKKLKKQEIADDNQDQDKEEPPMKFDERKSDWNF